MAREEWWGKLSRRKDQQVQKPQGGKSLAGEVLNPGVVGASGEKQHLEKRVWDEVHRSWHVFPFCSKNNEEQLGSLSICPSPTLKSCCVRVAQWCPTLYNPMNCSPPGSSVLGISQAGILEWVAIPSPGDLPDPGIESRSPALQADSLPSEPPEKSKAIT